MRLALVADVGAGAKPEQVRNSIKNCPHGAGQMYQGGNLVARLQGVTCKRNGIVHGEG